MEEKRKYPISENKCKELIDPIIKRELKKPGRLTKVSHYKFFVGFYMYWELKFHGAIFHRNRAIGIRSIQEQEMGVKTDFFGIYYTTCKALSSY